jgi:SAM-dependent methyltransferase
MSNGGKAVSQGDGGARAGVRYYKRDFWSKENLKYDRPHYRMQKSARIIRKIAGDRPQSLLDVGCGPAALKRLLPPNIDYYGIDIAIQSPAPYLVESDFLESRIGIGDKKFGIVIAQGVFEYVGALQPQKFAEIAEILEPGGTFIASYVNFAHRQRDIYWPYSNIQSPEDFRASLADHFVIRRVIPTSHNWHHGEPNRRIIQAANMHLNVNIPYISRVLAVEHFFICSPRHAAATSGPGRS